MAEGMFSKTIFGSIMIVLFAFLCLSWMIGFAEENNVDTSLIEDQGAFSYTDINSTLSNVQDDAEDLKEVFTQSEGQDVGFIEGFFTATTTFFSLPIDMFATVISMFDLIVIGGISYLWQDSPVGFMIISVITGLIIYFLIFGVFRLLKQGD